MSVKSYTKGEMDHLTLERIHSYMEGRLMGIDAEKVEEHLIACNRCHGLFASIKDIGSTLKKSFMVEPRNGCPEDLEIGAAVRQELDAGRLKAITGHLNTCDYCMDRTAMYYKASLEKKVELKTPKEWVERAVYAFTGDNDRVKEEVSYIRRFLRSVIDAILSLPPLPGYAIAAASVVFLIWISFQEKIQVVNIPSSQRITINETGPPSSFAFMGEDRIKRFEGMEVKKEGKNLIFSWKPIDGAKVSEFILRKKGFDKDITAAKLSLKGDSVTIPLDKVQFNERYEWVISGLTEGGRNIEAIAEFVLVR